MSKVINKSDITKLFPKRDENSNKGDCGRVLVVAGSYDGASAMCGAAYLAACAAYRTGAGIVEIFTARENYSPVASRLPEAVYTLYGGEEKESVSERLAERIAMADSVVIGCGLGKSDISKEIVKAALKVVDKPLVIDADALNIIAEDSSLLSFLDEKQRKRTVITPHPGEMSRLCKNNIGDILSDPVSIAQNFASLQGITCLLKGHRTVISDGDNTYINHSGNAGMATAGMGDVLAGMIGAMLADRKRDGDFSYLVAAVAYIHGLCGDRAAQKCGEYSLMASDLIDQIADAIKQ